MRANILTDTSDCEIVGKARHVSIGPSNRNTKQDAIAVRCVIYTNRGESGFFGV